MRDFPDFLSVSGDDNLRQDMGNMSVNSGMGTKWETRQLAQVNPDSG